MATCVIECNSDLQKRVGSSNSAISKAAVASLRPMALPTELPTKSKPIPINNKPGPSSNSIAGSFNDFRHQHNNRGIKRSANLTSSSSWADDDGAASILSMATKFSTSTISDRRKASISSIFSKPTMISSSSNDPSDVLLHQLTQVCEQAQKTGAIEPSKSNKLTINTVLESDKNSSTLKTTKLVNHFISCFVVGGEIRLCSPQIYSVIMKDVHEDDVTHWIREYNIVDHMASHEQITSLKLNRAIPPELGSCGLMTKTNAERLVGALIDPNNYRILPEDKRDKFDPILVEHDCFGGCEGRLYSVLFPGPCIECIQCKCLMTTEAFCRHSHISGSEKSFEPCHWGFDAANWAKYIRLHHLAENNQESIDRFYSFIKAHHSQQHHQQQQQSEDTLEDNLEVLAKQSMISAPLSALAVQLLAAQHAQQQQQQQHFHGSASTSSGINNNHGVVSAPSSLPTSSFIPPPPPSTSTLSTTSAIGGSAQQHQQSSVTPAISNNTNPLSHLLPLLQLQQSLGSNAPQQQQQVLAQLQALFNNNQQQQQQPQAASSNPGAALLAAFQQQQQQKQFELTLNSLRNAGRLPDHLMDESDIPRKRAHTISEMPSSSSSMAAVRPKQDDFSLSSIGFGMLQSDQQLIAILSELTENETYRRVTDLINLSIAQRVQPIADDNSRLRKENQKLQEELQAKNDLLARIAAAGIQQQQQQQQRHFSSTPSSMIPGSSTSHLHQNLHHLQQQQPPQIAEQDSDIEIDEQ